MDDSDEFIANVAILLTFEDGSTTLRNTYFVYEDGSWKHRFGSEEYELFATARTATASASAGTSRSFLIRLPAAGTKHVKVVVSSNVPVDVFISDDKLRLATARGDHGHENLRARHRQKLRRSTVSATNPNLRGNVSIEVYENGTLKSQDSDSTGLAQIVSLAPFAEVLTSANRA